MIENFPKHIALCGHPRAGKSLAQTLLTQLYGTVPVDDGYPLREFAVKNLGLSWDQVMTQEGKASTVEILGRVWTVREILGELGNRYEEMFGPHIMPFMALQRARTADRTNTMTFSYGSCRRDQGTTYQAAGGIVIEIQNPGVGPSNFEFDRYDPSVADYRIVNDALFRGLSPMEARRDLELKLIGVIAEHVAKKAVA